MAQGKSNAGWRLSELELLPGRLRADDFARRSLILKLSVVDLEVGVADDCVCRIFSDYCALTSLETSTMIPLMKFPAH